MIDRCVLVAIDDQSLLVGGADRLVDHCAVLIPRTTDRWCCRSIDWESVVTALVFVAIFAATIVKSIDR
jgi:hypothetical protein